MNPRLTATIVGIITLALGLVGLLYPERAMGLLGFAVLNPASASAALGEIRATYGGLFVVLGIYTLLTVLDPYAHRGRLRFIALLWLGACAGRMVGASVDGNPGVPGWVSAGFELIIGGALLAASFGKPPAPAAIAPQIASPAPATGQVPSVPVSSDQAGGATLTS